LTAAAFTASNSPTSYSSSAVRRRTGLTQDQWRATVAPYIRQVIEGGAYPHFARRVIEADDLGAEEEFEFGLSCLLDGVAARMGATAQR
jgi:Tetracyclin repressor-like, C-terminal domain